MCIIYIYQPRTCITCDRGDFRVASDGLFMSGAPGQDQRLGVFFGRRSGSGNRAMTWWTSWSPSGDDQTRLEYSS